MRRLEPEKLLTIITAGELESMLIAAMTRRGIRAYIIVQATVPAPRAFSQTCWKADTSS